MTGDAVHVTVVSRWKFALSMPDRKDEEACK
jgi:hypothetical protein